MHTRDMFDLTGKVALVTGGSRGLGLYMAHGLAEMGAHVAISARSEQDLATAQGELAQRGLSAAAISHDLADLDAIGQLVDRVTGSSVTSTSSSTTPVSRFRRRPRNTVANSGTASWTSTSARCSSSLKRSPAAA